MHTEVEKWVEEFVSKCHNPDVDDNDLCRKLVCLGVDIPDAVEPDYEPANDVEKSAIDYLNVINFRAWHAIKNSGRMERMKTIFKADLMKKPEAREIIGYTEFGRRLLTLFSPIPNRRWFMKAKIF